MDVKEAPRLTPRGFFYAWDQNSTLPVPSPLTT